LKGNRLQLGGVPSAAAELTAAIPLEEGDELVAGIDDPGRGKSWDHGQKLAGYTDPGYNDALVIRFV
jgi:hypothetical protein